MANVAGNRPDDVPEAAVLAFEEWSGLRVSFHDIEMRLAPFLPGHRHAHRNAFCRRLKQKGYEPACRRFELDVLRPWLQANPEGCAKVCHAGILEWSVPVMHEGRVSAVLFAGLRRRGRGVAPDLKDDRPTRAYALWPAGVPRPAQVTPAQSRLYLEGLRQLAARLQLWLEARERLEAEALPDGAKNSSAQARARIERFIAQHYREPVTLAQLARALFLSRSRAAHVVKETCGQTFVAMLKRHRLRHAADLLWRTQDSVADVALASGFGDVSYFHKAFRRQYRLTPHQYRKHGRLR